MATATINARMRRTAKRPGQIFVEPPKPTAWERFLLRHEITHDQAVMSLIRGCGGHAHKLRAWVRAHYFKTYVPEDVLEAAQLDRESNWRW